MFGTVITQYKSLTGRRKINMLKVFYNWLFNPNFRVKVWVAYLQQVRSGFIKKMIQNHLEVKYSVLISSKAKIGAGLSLEHFIGIAIGQNVVIGRNCKIYQNVTIGQKNDEYPVIGDNVVIYPGAKIIGGIKVGNNVQIGANAVVLQDIPDNSLAVGVPARILKRS